MSKAEEIRIAERMSTADLISIISRRDHVVSVSADGTRYITLPESILKSTDHSQTA